MISRSRGSFVILALIIVSYLILGVAYAVETPKWETPDEPAHFNYVVYLAENYRFPVLQMGDYPYDYLEIIKAAKFPEDMPIDPIRYESHQPPLYYVASAILYKIVSFLSLDGRVLTLRLFSVILSSGLLYVAYQIIEEIFPENEMLALGTTASVAFVPMHIAMTAAINNDTLAELILASILLFCIQYLRSDFSWRRNYLMGFVLGLGLLTKTTVYIGLPLVLITVVIKNVRITREVKLAAAPGTHLSSHFVTPIAAIFMEATQILIPAFVLTLPWFVRNALVYGNGDILGLRRHDAIVIGQLRTDEWAAQLGTVEVLKTFALTTFRSFWAQFGWMGILVDERIYLLLAFLCALAGLGFVLFLWKLAGRKETASPSVPASFALSSHQKGALGLLALSGFFTLSTYLWYNLQFVQPQGRYLFPAVVPLGLAFALGLQEILAKGRARMMVALFSVLLSLLVVKGLWTGDFNRLSVLMLGGGLMAFGFRALLPERYDGWVFALPYLGLFGLDILCLFWFIVPYFQ